MINWITENLGTAAYVKVIDDKNISTIDVRVLADKKGNTSEEMNIYIDKAVGYIHEGLRVVICCDVGISRSNSVAVGVLCRLQGCTFSSALKQIVDSTGIFELRPEVLNAVRESLGIKQKPINNNLWLVTGGSGSLGTLIQQSIANHIECLSPNKDKLNLLQGSVLLDQFIKEHGVGRVVHFGAPRISNVNEYLGNSLTMTKNVIDACSSSEIPLTIMSRWEVFAGLAGGDYEVTETSTPHPSGVLGETKFLIETLASHHMNANNLCVQIIRSGIVFNEHIQPNFMRTFVEKARKGEEIYIHQYINGFSAIDLIHADDWVEGFLKIVSSDQYGVFHLGGQLASIPEIASAAFKLFGRESRVKTTELHETIARVSLKSDKINTLFGWAPKKDWRELNSGFTSVEL